MTITIPKPLALLFLLVLTVGGGLFLYQEIPAIRRYIKFETM
jgi:hypothetical protein